MRPAEPAPPIAGGPVGRGAVLTTWSFHPRKLLTTGEGGMLTTPNAEWAARARRLREHAMSVSATDRQSSVLAPAEDYLEVGFNYRMTDLQAAIGLVQLRKLPEIVARRREFAAAYAEALADISELRPVADPEWGTSNFQSYWVEVLPGACLDRDGVLQALADAGISARRGIMAANRQPAYRGRNTGIVPLPATERLTDHTLILPLFHQMTDAERRRVLTALRSAVTGRGTGRNRGAA